MMKFLLVVIIIIALTFLSNAQTLFGDLPSVNEQINRSEQFLQQKLYSNARSELESLVNDASFSEHREKLMLFLVQACAEDNQPEETYQWATTFLNDYPNSGYAPEALYHLGVSAFRTERIDVALSALNKFLSQYNDHSLKPLVLYWRGECELEREEWQSAIHDFQACYLNMQVSKHRDDALLGLAVANEQQGQRNQAISYYEQLLREFPRSNRAAEARLHLALMYLETNNLDSALTHLKDAREGSDAVRELFLLLSAETQYQLTNYREAELQFRKLIDEYSDSSYEKIARRGVAWSRIKLGKFEAAKLEFDTLSRGNDSLARKALYQSGVLAEMLEKPNEAKSIFESLVDKFPYDMLAERAYYELGMLHYRAGRYREAQRNFQFAARLFPESPHRAKSFRMLGEASVMLGNFSNAQSAFAQVQKLQPRGELHAAALYQEGIALYHLGRFKSSAERFTQFLQQFSTHEAVPEAYVWKAEALYQDGKMKEAELAYATAMRYQNNPMREKAMYGLAWSLFEQKKFSQAAAAFDRFSQTYPNSDLVAEASLRTADCYFFMHDYDKASAMYASLATKKDGRSAEYAAFQLAMSYLQRGDAERGIRELRNFLIRFPTSAYNEVVQFNIGWTFFSKEQYAEALAEFRALIRNYSESQLMPRVLFNMGDAFYNLHQYDSARVYYQKVLTDFPTSPLANEALNGLQFAYEAEGRSSEALAAIEQFMKSKPNDSSQEELLLRKGDILFGQGDFAGAVAEYQNLLARNPSRPVQAKALNQLARAYELENNFERAVSYYEQIRRDLTDTELAPQATLALCVLYNKMKRYQDAVNVVRDFDGRFPTSPLVPEANYQLGVSYLSLKEKEAAQRSFLSTIEKYPTDIFAERSRLQLARILQEKKEYQASIDTLEGIVSRRNDDLAAEALLLMGEDYLLLKKTKDALRAFLDVSEQYTEFPLLVERGLLGQGECYERLREKKKARDMYQRVVETAVDPQIKKDAEERLKRLR
jgi:TolA-binding protein